MDSWNKLLLAVLLFQIFLFGLVLDAKASGKEESGNGLEFAYVMGNPICSDEISMYTKEDIVRELLRIKKLGTKIVIQVFSQDSTPADWETYFDAAVAAGIKAIPFFQGIPLRFNEIHFDLDINKKFLQHMKNHPALYALFLIDEPFEKITSSQLQLLYKQAKEIAPDIPMLVQFSRSIMKGEKRKNPNKQFKSGMCDICQISALPFRDYGDGKNWYNFYKELLIEHQGISRSVIKREDPNAKIWTSVQVFGRNTDRKSFSYMPDPAELQELVDILLSPELKAAGALSGMCWQKWRDTTSWRDETEDTLADPEFKEQRRIVKDTWDRIKRYFSDIPIYGVMRPVAMNLARWEYAYEFEVELDRIKTNIPALNLVWLCFERETTTRDDWLTFLDICHQKGVKAVVGFGDYLDNGKDMPYRPRYENGEWQWSSLEDFVSDRECITHPALYAVFTVDEPWHHRKLPFYTGDQLKGIYADLKSLAPDGSDFKILVQFSRELWKRIHRDGRPECYWDKGICDIVQISALEFQKGDYQHELLDSNHYWSRKIIHEKTPNIPLFTSVQVMGRRYGPHAGYWFPRERDGYHDLLTLLNDLTATKYENEHKLGGFMFQCWDSLSEEKRPYQYTLGDQDLEGKGLSQCEAAQDAINTINKWISRQNEPVTPLQNMPIVVSQGVGTEWFESWAGENDILVFFGDNFDEIPKPTKGKVGWNVPSFNHVIETENEWSGKIDVIIYDYEMWVKTPDEEKNDPDWASRRAQEFVDKRDLMLIQNSSWNMVTDRDPDIFWGDIDEEKLQTIAKNVDNYGFNAYGLRNEDPQGYIEWIKECSNYAREVNSDIKIWPMLDARNQSAEEMYDMVGQLEGYIDGIGIMGNRNHQEVISDFIELMRKNKPDLLPYIQKPLPPIEKVFL